MCGCVYCSRMAFSSCIVLFAIVFSVTLSTIAPTTKVENTTVRSSALPADDDPVWDVSEVIRATPLGSIAGRKPKCPPKKR